jgi:hypothetical protein
MSSIMEVMVVWERAEGSDYRYPPPVAACLLLQRLPDGSYQLVLPPLPVSRRLVGVMWVLPTEFTMLAARYMDEYVARRIAPT